ncbi:MAG: phosphosulfolactate synthase [Methanobacterium sp. BRmetb2]|nr:MAG: phosphosulfolactate synthase [Methanobacterium sp. BRmetb2]
MKAFNFLTPERVKKPRTNGTTMMLDKGMGLNTAEDLMEISGEYVDFAKFGWGTITIHDREIIKNKVEMYLGHDIKPYPGGTLFELAYINNKVEEYLQEADKLGFDTLEISDGSTEIPLDERRNIISNIKEQGFFVISEVGKKNPEEDHKIDTLERTRLINFDLESGADKVLIEARESGKGIGIFDDDGNVKEDEVDLLIKNLDVKNIIWEAPQKNQQVYFILKFGGNVNLGNIPPEEITALETMRRGLRGDTLGKVDL